MLRHRFDFVGADVDESIFLAAMAALRAGKTAAIADVESLRHEDRSKARSLCACQFFLGVGSGEMVERKLTRAENARAEHERLLLRERALWAGGKLFVAGLDEAGAGPWAGPVSAGCVVLDSEKLDPLLGVNDSKKLTHERRVRFAALIREHVCAWAVGRVSAEEIDRINIRQASLLAMRRALDAVCAQLQRVDYVLIDARELKDLALPQEGIIRGDSSSLSIAAASILAKVSRDEEMMAAAQAYPEYGFERHKGYGTKQHQAALAQFGVTPIHRKSFAPIRARLALEKDA